MGISASKTYVLSKGDVVELPLVELPVADPPKASGLKAANFIVLSKPKQPEEKKVNRISEWKAEKPGKKSAFMEDMLTNFE